jgi:predicted ferric reductase
MIAVPAIAVALWAGDVPLRARTVDLRTSLSSLGIVFGLAGFAAYAVNLVLGGRWWFTERLFGGLDRMYRAHRANGQWAFSLLLAHGVLMVAATSRSLGDAVDLLLPSGGWSVTLGALAFAGMSVALATALWARLGHETFLWVHRIFGAAFLVALIHVFRSPDLQASFPGLRAYLLVLGLAGVASFVYRSVLGDTLVKRSDYRVFGLHHLDEKVMEIEMETLGDPVRFVPGQFVFVRFDSESLRRAFYPLDMESEGHFGVVRLRPGAIANQYHPFSITSAVGERNLRIAVKAVGDYTTAMRRLEPGARVNVEGPYGSFSHLAVGNDKQVWVAGGIGITPFLSMARSLEGEPFEIDLFYAMEHGGEAYFLDELFAIADANPLLKIVPIRRDALGFVTADDIAAVSADLHEREVLLCGPPMMMDGLTKQFIDLGVDRNRVHFEQFRFTG